MSAAVGVGGEDFGMEVGIGTGMDHMDVSEQIISLSNGSIDSGTQNELEEDSQGNCQTDQSKL